VGFLEVGAHKTEVVVVMAVCCLICMLFVSFWGLVWFGYAFFFFCYRVVIKSKVVIKEHLFKNRVN